MRASYKTTSMAESIDWLKALHFGRAYSNCHDDLYGDWYRDPWAWPEMKWVVRKRPDLLAARLNSDHIATAGYVDVAKENFATRPAIVLDPVDRLIYQALVDRESMKLVGAVPPWAFVGRLHRKNPRPGIYPRKSEWDNYRDRLHLLVSRYRVVLKTDIVSFFSSIPIDPLVEHVQVQVGGGRVPDRLELMLRRWDSLPNRSGLMQRFAASSVLAASYLRPVDDVLHRYSANVGSAKGWIPPRAVRWMDDIWLFGTKPERLRRAQLDLQDAMRSLGLNMNASKTDVLEGADAEQDIQQREHSAVDSGLAGAPRDVEPLNALIDRLVNKPERANRTSAKFVCRRLRDAHVFDRVDDLAEVANRMPQASDALARLFRDSEKWRDLQDWFVAYAQSDWARIEWSVGQFATMFPSSEVPEPVLEFLRDKLLTNTPLTVTAVAAQRVAAWDPPSARAIIRERLAKVDHPLQRRVLALAALEAGEEARYIRTVLSQNEDNAVTLEFLKDRSFRPVRSVSDFSGS